MAGLTRPISDIEETLIESVVKDSYNTVSGCQDIYKRRMHRTDLVKQTLVTSNDGPSQVAIEIKMVSLKKKIDSKRVFGVQLVLTKQSQ